MQKNIINLKNGEEKMRKNFITNKKNKIKERGMTLLALVVTVIVLLILARSKHTNGSRRQWIN